jgi:guanine nucleotide-binding protein G(I)/G(S)/G(T) subunit beta-1
VQIHIHITRDSANKQTTKQNTSVSCAIKMSKEAIDAAKSEAEGLLSQLREQFATLNDGTIQELSSDVPAVPKPKIKCRRTLQGHSEKVVSLHWSFNSNSLVSAAQDGFLIVWDALGAFKEYAIRMPRSQYVWCSAFAPSGAYIAGGGMDNVVSVYNLASIDSENPPPPNKIQPCRQLTGHSSRITAIRFIDNALLLSAGDMPRLWDLSNGVNTQQFTGHYEGEVNAIAVQSEGNIFLSGADDKTVRVWDRRADTRPQQTIRGHGNDVRSVEWIKGNQQFVTGSYDGTARLFDIRAARDLAVYQADDINKRWEDAERVFSACTSLSARYVFVAYGDGEFRAFDTLKTTQVGTFAGHRHPRSQTIWSIGLSHDGLALATASSDTTIRVWA